MYRETNAVRRSGELALAAQPAAQGTRAFRAAVVVLASSNPGLRSPECW